jgi:hypothetical protein
VLNSLRGKLNLNLIEYFGLALKPKNEKSLSKFIFLNENFHLSKIEQVYGNQLDSYSNDDKFLVKDEEDEEGDYLSELGLNKEKNNSNNLNINFGARKRSPKFQCLFRFIFVPGNYDDLLLNDQNAFNYLYEQSMNDILNDRFGNELKYEIALHLATLCILHDQVDLNNTARLKNNAKKSSATSSVSSSLISSSNSSNGSIENLSVECNIVNSIDLKYF